MQKNIGGLKWSVNRWGFRSRRNLGSEAVVLSAAGSLFHSLGANGAKSLGQVDRCISEIQHVKNVQCDISLRVKEY